MADGSTYLMQVVSNLLSNAVKCTDAGEVLITIENKFDTEDRTNKSSNKEVIVSITYRDIISLLGEQTQREIPVYIIGMPDDPFDAELIKSEFHTIVKHLNRISPKVEEFRRGIPMINSAG